MKSFGKLLRELRIKAGLSQYELSDLVRIHPSHISRLERGERKPRFRNVIRFINELRLSEEEGEKLLSAAGYSSKINRPLIYFSPHLDNIAEMESTDSKYIPFLKNPALKTLAEILSDPEFPAQAKKEIEEKILSYAQWLKDQKKRELFG